MNKFSILLFQETVDELQVFALLKVISVHVIYKWCIIFAPILLGPTVFPGPLCFWHLLDL